MNTLKTIQKVFCIAKILCQIVFVCCIVGCCLCIAAAVSLAVDIPALSIGGVNIVGLVEAQEGRSGGVMALTILAGAFQVAALGILAKLAQRYFAREQKDGTPFTLGGANQLRRLGIYCIWVPVVAQVIAQVICQTLSSTAPVELSSGASIGYGLVLILLSLVCQYGAELQSGVQ